MLSLEVPYIYLLEEIPFRVGGRGFQLSFIENIRKTEVKEPLGLLLHIRGNLKVAALGIHRKCGFPREAMAVFYSY